MSAIALDDVNIENDLKLKSKLTAKNMSWIAITASQIVQVFTSDNQKMYGEILQSLQYRQTGKL